MPTFLEPGRSGRRVVLILWVGGCLLLAAVLLAPRSARAADPARQPLPALSAVHDPGPRGGSPGAGGPLPGLSMTELALFNEGLFRASELEATCDACSDVPPGTRIPPGSPPDTTNSAGLGGRFNSDQCLACHSQPAAGGTSPALNPVPFAIAGRKGATNKVPFFERRDGPTREVRFLFNEDGTRDGSVHQKFTVAGRSDAPSCTLAQPDFERAAQVNGLGFRIPTPLFGLGLVDAIPDQEILSHLARHPARKQELGIHGTPNRATNTATISRFGWEGPERVADRVRRRGLQRRDGDHQRAVPDAKTEDPTCNLGAEPNDVTRVDRDEFDEPLELMADWLMFSLFTRFLDAPQPVVLTPAALRGARLFEDVGCSECHVPSMKTRPALLGPLSPALAGKTAKPFSDLVLHHMGANLADNVIQGDAGPDMFRTAPLWGVGQRLFFLHDGRTDDLQNAIRAHFSLPAPAHGRDPAYPASEANQVVMDYFRLQAGQQQDLLAFLRSL